MHPAEFQTYTPIIVSDPHHSFLLDQFGREIVGACVEITGLPPLFHVIRDEMLVSLLPEEFAATILDDAVDTVCADIPFGFDVEITPAGIPKATGTKPSWQMVEGFVGAERLITGTLRRLLSVKTVDLKAFDTEIRNLAAEAACPLVQIPEDLSDKTYSIVRPPVGEDDPYFRSVRLATLFSLATGIDQVTKDKTYSREAREKALLDLLGERVPGWIAGLDPLTRRTCMALVATECMLSEPDFEVAILGKMSSWFGTDGIFRDMDDAAGPVRHAVGERLRALCSGRTVVLPQAENACLISSEPVSGVPIEAKDGLYGDCVVGALVPVRAVRSTNIRKRPGPGSRRCPMPSSGCAAKPIGSWGAATTAAFRFA